MKRSAKTFWVIFLFLIAGGFLGYTVGSSFRASERSASIRKVLEEHCDCKKINQVIYAKGIQFGKEGVSTEKGEYELVDCTFTSIAAETKRIHELLKAKVKGFDKVDLLELEFVNGDTSETIYIKKGIIQ